MIYQKNNRLVAVVGRPNVGKSTLFNRLIKKKQAITHDESGITRDRHYGEVEWSGEKFTLIDTGGYIMNSDDVFEKAIRKQVKVVLEEANLILFIVDGQLGLNDYDKSLANLLRATSKPILVVVNKTDTNKNYFLSQDFYGLGFEHLHPISAVNGLGTGDLMDNILEHLPENNDSPESKELPHIAIIGKPNVGKSSLINSLLAEERSIVTDIPGTTRDAIHEVFNKFGFHFVLTDTAGLRRKAKIQHDIEFYALLRTLKVIENADVCVLMIDVENGISSQDLHIIQQVEEQKKGLVLMVNKWDLVENKNQHTTKKYEKTIRERLSANYIPIIFTSVLERKRILTVLKKSLEIYKNRKQHVSTSLLNKNILADIEKTPPPGFKNKHVSIKYITQLPTVFPTFAFFCNHPQYVQESYKNFLINRLRFHFNFEGVPLKVVFRKK